MTYSSMFSKDALLDLAFRYSTPTGPSSVYSVPLSAFQRPLFQKARPNWTSSIFFPLYQSGHKGLREMFFFIGWFSFRRKPVYQGDLDDIEMYFMAAVKEIKRASGAITPNRKQCAKRSGQKMFNGRADQRAGCAALNDPRQTVIGCNAGPCSGYGMSHARHWNSCKA